MGTGTATNPGEWVGDIVITVVCSRFVGWTSFDVPDIQTLVHSVRGVWWWVVSCYLMICYYQLLIGEGLGRESPPTLWEGEV